LNRVKIFASSLNNSPKNLFLKKILEKGIASPWQVQEVFFTHANLVFGGETYFAPPFNLPNPVSSWRGCNEIWADGNGDRRQSLVHLFFLSFFSVRVLSFPPE
jgi:hypothetical protein